MPIIAAESFDDALAALIPHLQAGGAAVVPTDTVYGIAVRAEDAAALADLYRRKGRDRSVATAVLVADTASAEELWERPSAGRRRLTSTHWPGPLTIIDRRTRSIGWDLGGDRTSIGVRCPDEPLIRALAAAVGPLAASSANPSGAAPVTEIGQVGNSLGEGLVMVDAGTLGGSASTVVDVRDGCEVIRSGPITEAMLRATWAPPTMHRIEGE